MPLQSSRIRSWTAALSVALLGCDPGIATQVLVSVDADDATRTRAEAIRITVLPKDAEPIERVEPLVGPEARLSFMFTQPLHPRGNDASRSFHVVVEALDGTAEPFVTRTVRGTYAKGERREVRILLTENCHDRPACGAERTCVEGACAPVCVETQPEDAPPLPTPPTSCATHRKPLTVPAETARSDQTGFPLLVSLTEDDDLAALATEDGSDIAFIGGNGALFDHELVLFQRDTGRLIAWVRVPVLRAAADTTLFMTFGAGVAERRPTAVWSDYELVVHLDEPAPPALDSSPNLQSSRPTEVTPGAEGRVGHGYEMNGSGRITFALSDPDTMAQFGRTDSFSGSAWVRYFEAREWAPLIFRGARNSTSGYSLVTDRPGTVIGAKVGELDNVVTSGQVEVPLDRWVYVAFVADRETDQLRTFIDGAQAGLVGDLGNVDPTADMDRIVLGATGGCCSIVGIVDEVHIAGFAWTEERVRLLHANQRDPASFVTVGELEAL